MGKSGGRGKSSRSSRIRKARARVVLEGEKRSRVRDVQAGSERPSRDTSREIVLWVGEFEDG